MKKIISFTVSLLIILHVITSCSESWLDPKPLSFYAPEQVMSEVQVMYSTIAECDKKLRREFYGDDAPPLLTEAIFSDISVEGTTDKSGPAQNMNAQITPSSQLNSNDHNKIGWYWQESFNRLKDANTVVTYIDNPTYRDEAERNALLGNAYFHRAYIYYRLVHQFGDVPFAGQLYREPKLNFQTTKREVILQKIKEDMEFAVKWTKDGVERGRVTKGACQHLLIKIYLALGLFDEAIATANDLINGGTYALMTQPFGTFVNPYPAHHNITRNVIWDLHRHENKAISANREVLYVMLSREDVSDSRADTRLQRNCVPFWSVGSNKQIFCPDGSSGGISDEINQEVPQVEMFGRGIGRMRNTPYHHTYIWDDDNDLRHSRTVGNWMEMEDLVFNNKLMTNMEYYKTPLKKYMDNGETATTDTIRSWFGWPHYKVWCTSPRMGKPDGGAMDLYLFRLAETYLLRAEAYWWKGQTGLAMADVNTIRTRAQCAPYTNEGGFDLLDIIAERARELYYEEPRKTELTRISYIFALTGKPSPYDGKTYSLANFSDTNFWYDHLMATGDFYNKGVTTVFGKIYTMSPYHVLWPVPAGEIEGNAQGTINQNKGYSGYENNATPLDYIPDEENI